MVAIVRVEKYTVIIEYHRNSGFVRPWVVRKESPKPDVVGAKDEDYATSQEALKEAVRFLTSSLKLREYPKPGDAPIFKAVVDWWKCAECERNTCDNCDNMKKEKLK